jgi:hypothetical protein
MTDQERIRFLEDKLKILEDENIGTTNALYEIENRMQSQIDALIRYTMNLEDRVRYWGEPNDIF